MKCIKFVFLIFCLATFSKASGQVGIKLGLHSFDITSPKDIIFNDTSTISYKSADLGFQGGLYGRIKLKNIFIESRAMFHSTKVSYNIENGDFFNSIRTESFTDINIPLLIGFELLIAEVFLGPVAHINIDSSSEIVEFDGYAQKFKTAEFGFRLGAGIDIGDASLSLEYEGNFSRFGEHITVGGQEYDFGVQPSRLLLNLGFKIF